jgi:hypothetical protein
MEDTRSRYPTNPDFNSSRKSHRSSSTYADTNYNAELIAYTRVNSDATTTTTTTAAAAAATTGATGTTNNDRTHANTHTNTHANTHTNDSSSSSANYNYGYNTADRSNGNKMTRAHDVRSKPRLDAAPHRRPVAGSELTSYAFSHFEGRSAGVSTPNIGVSTPNLVVPDGRVDDTPEGLDALLLAVAPPSSPTP